MTRFGYTINRFISTFYVIVIIILSKYETINRCGASSIWVYSIVQFTICVAVCCVFFVYFVRLKLVEKETLKGDLRC